MGRYINNCQPVPTPHLLAIVLVHILPMADVEHSRQRLQHLKRRAILPLITQVKGPNLPDLNNVQGDGLYLFPKVFGFILRNADWYLTRKLLESRELYFLPHL